MSNNNNKKLCKTTFSGGDSQKVSGSEFVNSGTQGRFKRQSEAATITLNTTIVKCDDEQI